MFVKPRKGLKVRDPVTKGLLPEAGALVSNSIYWTRRLRDHDVEECSPPSETETASTAAQPKEESAT